MTLRGFWECFFSEAKLRSTAWNKGFGTGHALRVALRAALRVALRGGATGHTLREPYGRSVRFGAWRHHGLRIKRYCRLHASVSWAARATRRGKGYQIFGHKVSKGFLGNLAL